MAALPDRMMAAVLHSAKDLRYQEVAAPEPGTDEVLIRVTANGLCGSDIHFFEDGRLGPYEVTKPYIPGHEACGTVVRPSTTGTGPAVGQRVAIEPGVPCRRCALCKSGRYNLCRDVVFMSEPPVNGTFAEYVALAADFAHPLPDSVDDESGAFVEPISVGIQACARGGLTAAQSVVVLGAGPIGLVTLLIARAFGAAAAFVVDVLPNRLGIAAELGASATVDAGEADVAEAVDELTGGLGVDMVFDTSGSFEACAAAPLIAARGGVVVQVGWPNLHQVPYPVEVVMERELDVRGVNRYCNTYPRAIALLASGKLDVSPLITHRFPFSEVCDAFRFASENREATLKVMVLND